LDAPEGHFDTPVLCSKFFSANMRVSATAPCRVDLAGATLDIWPLYLFHEKVVTVNFAVDRYTSCTVETRDDARIVLRSRDLARDESFECFDALSSAKRYRLPLLALIVRFFRPAMGLTVESSSEAPAGAGISGSSALMIAAASALNKITGRRYSLEKIREVAQNVEAQVIRVPTGSQDYYPAMYGGVSAIEHGPAGISRTCLGVDARILDERFVLAYTGAPRNSGINNWEVMKGHIDGNRAIHRNFDRIAGVALAMRTAVERNDWDEAGRLMREEWSARRRNSPGISTLLIDQLITAARRTGGIGAKACGAGGGGCVVFLVNPGAKKKVADLIASAGAQVLDARVARRGVAVRAG
jgi:D-glycero-alpha-D-manno-heptose-7-phosphate kinase